MAIQQMGLMAYKAPPAGGGDSAFLPEPFAIDNTTGGPSNVTFNLSGLNSSNVSGVGATTNEYTWKTGPNAASAYEVRFTNTAGILPGGSAVNTWIILGATDTPQWTVESGAGNFAGGRLVIRNISVPGTELANVTCSISADPNA